MIQHISVLLNNKREIMRKAIERSNRPLNKYNEALHMDTEELTGEANDRTGYDAGMEPEKHNF